MKRVTVAVTFSEDYISSDALKRVLSAMVNAGVLKATELNIQIAALDAKTGTVRTRP